MRHLSSGESWIIDGNYGDSLAIRVTRCDTIVFFDLPRVTCIWGVLQRWPVNRFERRAELPEGCTERVNLEFLLWVWRYPRTSRPRIAAALQQAGPEVKIMTITRRAQTRVALDTLSRAHQPVGA